MVQDYVVPVCWYAGTYAGLLIFRTLPAAKSITANTFNPILIVDIIHIGLLKMHNGQPGLY